MRPEMTHKGFTLIELLVVVLIIGILAAFALPLYQKAVWRSRNAGLKSLLKALASAQETYYLANGTYATQFGQLDMDVPLRTGGRGACQLGTDGSNDSVRTGDNMQVILNTHDARIGATGMLAVWTEGKYKCSGFYIFLIKDGNKLLCAEMRNGTFIGNPGDFCVGIEHGALEPGGPAGGAARYLLP